MNFPLKCSFFKIHTHYNTKYHAWGQTKKNEMGGACGTYGGEVHIGFWWGNLKEKDHLKDLGVDGRLIRKWIFKKRDGGNMDWIHLAQDSCWWRAVVSVEMNLRVPQKCMVLLEKVRMH
jgi:hypothetical protein